MDAATATLGSWVELQTEVCRGGRVATIAVNRRDGVAVSLSAEDVAALEAGRVDDGGLLRELRAGGFLADSGPPVPAPTHSRVVRFLRTFDVHWTGANRWIEVLHGAGLHRAWQRHWLAAQAVLAAIGVAATVAAFRSGRPLELRPDVAHVPGYVILSLLAIAAHELAHGLVVVHHGRRVSSVGFRLHLGSPSFYVESVDALLLTRRQRIIQALAGVWAEWQFASVVAVLLVLAPDGVWVPVLQRFVVLTAVTIGSNLLPFAGLDGSLVLADAVREPSLAADSKAAIGRLGRTPQRGDAMLVGYAIVNTAVAAALFLTGLGLWYLLFGRLTATLAEHGPLGWFAAALVILVSFGPSVAAAATSARRVTALDRIAFRLERRRRVWFTERLAAIAPFDTLDERALGVVAGQLRLCRIARGIPFHDPGFEGHLLADRTVQLHDGASLRTDEIAFIAAGGVAITTPRRLRPTHAALLPTSAMRLAREHAVSRP